MKMDFLPYENGFSSRMKMDFHPVRKRVFSEKREILYLWIALEALGSLTAQRLTFKSSQQYDSTTRQCRDTCRLPYLYL